MGAQARVLRDIRRRIKQLAATISQLEHEYESDPSTATLAKIRELVTEHNDAIDHCSRQRIARYYGEGGHPGRSLAQKMAAPRSPEHITELLDEDGVAHHSPPELCDLVLQFYTNLYASGASPSAAEIDAYLDDVVLGWISNSDREFLVQPFDEEDVWEAISSLPTCKAAGTDGLPGEYYKAYASDLAPRLLEMFAEAYEKGTLPPFLREALLVTLLKPDKPSNRWDSYRPLSIINIDAKILAKMIACNYKGFLWTAVHIILHYRHSNL